MFSTVITSSEKPSFLYDPSGNLLSKVFEVDVTGCWKRKPVGDGKVIDIFYSRMITQKPIPPRIGVYTLSFPRDGIGFLIEIDDCIDLEDGKFLIYFHGYRKP